MSRGKLFVKITFLLAACVVHEAFTRKPYAYFDTLECPYHDADYGEVKCWLMPDNRGQLMMNVKLLLKQDITSATINYRFVIVRKDKNVTYLNLDIDYCEAIKSAMKTPVLRLVTEEIWRVGNFPLGCPLKKGVDYHLDNFTINSKYLPSFTPQMTWATKAIFYTNSTRNPLWIMDSSGKVDIESRKYG